VIQRTKPDAIPPTAMAHAFWDALQRRACKQHDGVITVPSGTVNARELTRVVLAIKNFVPETGGRKVRRGPDIPQHKHKENRRG
jgi:hypothetical protein